MPPCSDRQGQRLLTPSLLSLPPPSLCSPQQFEAALSLREQRAGGRDYHPTGMAWPSSAGGLVGGMMMAEGACHVAPLQQGAYYLAGVDGLYRRHYARSSVL